jgi:hypothetical protein
MSDSSFTDEDERLEQAIKAATSAAPSGLPEDSTDGLLRSILSLRAYDAVVRKSRSRAQKNYEARLGPELNRLRPNHDSVQEVIGTEGDSQGTWKVDPRTLTPDKLEREIAIITRKLHAVEVEVVGLTGAIQKKQEKLELVRAQNQKLEALRAEIGGDE